MFKRARWMSIGAVAGLGGSLWAQRQVRRTVERLPEAAAEQVARRARNWRDDVRDALAEGRAAMADREEELRGQLRVPSPALPSEARPRALPPHAAEPALPPTTSPIIDVDERRAGRPDPEPRRRAAQPAPRRHRPARRDRRG